MPIWPGRNKDPDDERTSAELGRGYGTPTGPKPGTPSPRRGQFKGPLQQQVIDIMKANPGISELEIARKVHEELRPDEPFEGRHKRTAKSNVGVVLRALEKFDLASNSNPGKQAGGGGVARSSWTWGPVAPKQGAPKPPGWTGGHARAGEGRPENRRPRGRSYGVSEPATSESEVEDTPDDRYERHRRGRGNPENWRKDEDKGKKGGKTDAQKRAEDPQNPENWRDSLDRQGGGGSGGGKSFGVSKPASSHDDSDNKGDDDKGSGFLKPSW